MSRALAVVAFGFAAVLASAVATTTGCARPAPPVLPDGGGFVEHGPTTDLAGFITPTPDIAQSVVTDMAKPTDAATAVAPADLSTPTNGACGAITYAGTCTANVLKYCLSNVLTTLDCGSKSMACKVDTTGDANCHYVAGAACGALDSVGVCDGNTVAYCSSNKVVLINCTTAGDTCDDTFFAGCF